MASEASPQNLTESGITIPSDSENYDANHELSPSPPSSSSSPLILYKPPTFWGLVRGAAINLLLPFVNGLMLGFGELVANEVAFRFGWSGTKVRIGWALSWPWVDHARVFHTNPLSRYFPPTDLVPVAWVLAWRCAPIPSNGSGETVRSLTRTRRWSEGYLEFSIVYIQMSRKAHVGFQNETGYCICIYSAHFRTCAKGINVAHQA